MADHPQIEVSTAVWPNHGDNEARLALAIDAARIGIWDLDTTNKRWAWNARTEQIFGMQPGKSCGSFEIFAALLHPADRDKVVLELHQAIASTRRHAMRFRIVRPDGEVRWIEGISRAVPGPDGTTRLLGVVLDVTERQAAEAALIESEVCTRLATDAARIGTWQMDLRTARVIWSEINEQIFGLRPGEFLGTSEQFLALVHAEDRERVRDALRKCIEEGGRYLVDYRVSRPDGATRWVSGHGMSLSGPDGRPEKIVGLVIDVTEHKQTVNALVESERLYRSVVENQTELVCHYLPDTTLTFVNDAYARYFGKTREELIGSSFMCLIPEAAHSGAFDHLQLLLADTGKTLVVEHPVMDAAGNVCWQEWVDHVIHDSHGKVVELQGIGRDITARKKAEDALCVALDELRLLKHRLEVENAYLQEELDRGSKLGQVVCHSAAMFATLEQVKRVAPSDTTVLLMGETGTGKELLANALHKLSKRRDRPLVRLNCAALPSSLIESELFGHERGSFTGATARRLGRFEIADGGTLFLDEVGELGLELQAKLLRVLQESEFERVGSSDTRQVNVRIIAATNRNLAAAVEQGSFRADLFYRLNVVPISVPPLRARQEDILPLAETFLANASRRLGRPRLPLPANVAAALRQHDWPGNVRELENVIERAVILSPETAIELLEGWDGRVEPSQSTTRTVPSQSEPPPTTRRLLSISEIERTHIISVLEHTNWRIEGPHGAAAILGMNPSTLRFRMKKMAIQRRGQGAA